MTTPSREAWMAEASRVTADNVFCVCKRVEGSYRLFSAPEVEDVLYRLVTETPQASLQDLLTSPLKSASGKPYGREAFLQSASTLEELLLHPDADYLLESYFRVLNRSNYEYNSLKPLTSVCKLQEQVLSIPPRRPGLSAAPALYLAVRIPHEEPDLAQLLMAESMADVHFYYLRSFGNLDDLVGHVLEKEISHDELALLSDECLAVLFDAMANQHSDFMEEASGDYNLMEELIVERWDRAPPTTYLFPRMSMPAKSARSIPATP